MMQAASERTQLAYPAYKPSGAKWIGKIPNHWEVRRLKYSVDLINRKVDGADSDLQYTGLEHIESWTGKRLEVNGKISSDGQAALYKRGDVLFGKLRPYLAKAHASEADGLCTSEFLVLRPKAVHQEFLLYYILNPDFISIVDSSTYGAKMPRANWDFIGNLPTLVPPTHEQQAIVTFIEHETSKIDELIKKKKRQIELLQEKRASLVHRAIQGEGTRFLRLGWVLEQAFRPVKRNHEEFYVPIGLYNWARGIFHKPSTQGADLGDSDFFWVKPDDLILSGQFAWEGAVALASDEDDGCVATHRYPIFRGKSGVLDTAYLFAFFTTRTGHFLLNEHSRGAAGRNRPLNSGTLLKETIPVPPIAAQLFVARHVYVEKKLEKIVSESCNLLQEYRASLISSVVTGKIDVRKDLV